MKPPPPPPPEWALMDRRRALLDLVLPTVTDAAMTDMVSRADQLSQDALEAYRARLPKFVARLAVEIADACIEALEPPPPKPTPPPNLVTRGGSTKSRPVLDPDKGG